MDYPTHSDQPISSAQSQTPDEAETGATPGGQPVIESQAQAEDGTLEIPIEPQYLPLEDSPTEFVVEDGMTDNVREDQPDDEVSSQLRGESGGVPPASESITAVDLQPQSGAEADIPPDDETDQLQSIEDADLPLDDLPEPVNAVPARVDEDTEVSLSTPTNEPLGNAPSPFTSDFLPMPEFVDAPAETNPRKVALILSGGGARGAFQVGAEKYAREVKGYQWDIIAGVSVGAMNAAMLAMHRYARLLELWDNISNDQVYTGGFNLISIVKILFGAKSFYGVEPLKKLMQREFEAGKVLDDLHVGAVSLVSGEYVQFTKESLELPKAILASASIPVVFPPVDVNADHPAMVDGGVRNISPVGDVLELEPDEIVIINCSNEQPPLKPDASANVLSIGMRSLDIMQNEIFRNDMKEFLRINALVKEAEQQGHLLHHPKTGRPFKYYPCHVIEPDSELGDTLDFSQISIQTALRMGVRRAREVLGRP